MSDFAITIIERKPVRTAGVSVATLLANASTDCPHLWENVFGPRMATFPADPNTEETSYGVSIMDQPGEGAFTYWAVMPLVAGADVPEGMQELTIPGGTYASCEVASLAQLGEAFNYIYLDWPKTQTQYTLNMGGACLEIYGKDYLSSGKLTVQCPLIKA